MVAVARRRDASLRERPVVVLDGAGTRAMVVHVSSEAREEGVREHHDVPERQHRHHAMHLALWRA